MARAIMEALCQELVAQLDLVALNVHAKNEAAIRCYDSLGFKAIRRYVEGFIERR